MSAVPEPQETTTAPMSKSMAASSPVAVDPDVCVGAGLCTVTAPRVFDQDLGGVVVVLDPVPAGEDLQAARTAASMCPSGAISLRR